MQFAIILAWASAVAARSLVAGPLKSTVYYYSKHAG